MITTLIHRRYYNIAVFVLYNKFIIQRVFITITTMSTKRFFPVLFIGLFLSIVLPLSAVAQSGVPPQGTVMFPDKTETPGNNAPASSAPVAAIVATVELQNALIERQEGNTYTIGFDLTNTRGVQPEVNFAVLVFKRIQDNPIPVLIDSQAYQESMTLVEGVTVHKTITYTPPAFLKGDYEIWVSAFNGVSTHSFGQARAGTLTFLGTGEGIDIDSCTLTVKENDSAKPYTTIGGVAVSSGGSITADCTVFNSRSEKMTVIPILETLKRSPFGKSLNTKNNPELSFKPGTNNISLDIPVENVIGTYSVSLSFLSGDRTVSNKKQINYFVEGKAATARNVVLDKSAYKKGDTANVFLFWSMSKSAVWDDSADAIKEIHVKTNLFGGNGETCGNPIEQVFTNAEFTSNFAVPILKKCEQPIVSVQITDETGSVLDEAKFAVHTEEPKKNNNTIVIIVIGILAIIGVVGYFMRKNKSGNIPAAMAGFAILFMSAAMFGGFGIGSADALSTRLNYRGMWTNTDVWLDKSTYAQGETISIYGSAYTNGDFQLNDLGDDCNKIQGKVTAIVNGQAPVVQWPLCYSWSTTVGGGPIYATAQNTAGSYNAHFQATMINVYTGEYGVTPYQTACESGRWMAYRDRDQVSCAPYDIPYTVTAPLILPTVWITANPNPVDYNTNSTFGWGSANATSCRYTTNGGASWTAVALSGSTSGGPFTAATTITLECSGPGGTAQASVTITIKPPTVSLTASPSSIAPGGSSTLSWSASTGLTSCTATGGWSGGKSVPSGSEGTGSLSSSTTYNLSCTGPAGSASASATVTVVVPPPVPTVTISANPTTVPFNTASTLTWSSTNATSCTASNGWTGSKGTSGSQSTGSLTTGKTYTLTCTNATGSAVASATVTVGAAPPAPTVTLSASPNPVAYNTASTLTWTPTNATSCTATGGTFAGSKSVSGGTQSTGNLIANTTYSITCSGITSPSATASVTVTVGAAPPPLPTVTLSASPLTINYNTASTLTWSSTNADSCTASGAWTGSKATSGSLGTGNLTASQTYTLTCTNATGSANRSVTVTVNPPTPDFTLAKSNDIEVTIVGGVPSVSSKSTVTVDAVGSFANSIDLSVLSIAPAIPGIIYSLSNPNLTTGEYASGSLFSVTVPGTTASGTSVITVQGIGGGLTRTVNILLTIFGKDPEFENF